MFPFMTQLKLLVWMFFFDANAFRRWMRMGITALTLNGALWAGELEAFAPHKVVIGFRVVCFVLTFFVAAHGDPITVPGTSST